MHARLCSHHNNMRAREDSLARCRVLVLGAGGLGCELLKNLALLGIPELHVIDMDTVELTNLNRQFLFRETDIGHPKAAVAARYINGLALPSVVPGRGVRVEPHVGDLTQQPSAFWEGFTAVISGLDAIEPRRHANALLVRLTLSSNYAKCIPLIDGGSEGFAGHCKTILPGISACYECSLDTLAPPGLAFPLCTIANKPRLPQHIVMYVLTVEWPTAPFQAGCSFDDPEAVAWLAQRCATRAAAFGMNAAAFTTAYVLGVAKRIVPSVASTNAIVAAACCSELLKLVHDLTDPENMNNFLQYNGAEGCFAYSFTHQRLPSCPVCSQGDGC